MITVVGAGFAGVEAAWAIARLGLRVRLIEMRPVQTTPAHQTDLFAELVCSNSFKSQAPASPAGQLKGEMDALGSLVLEVAREHSVPGGQALCVDREAFARAITERIESHPLITVERREFSAEEASAFLPPPPEAKREEEGSRGVEVSAQGPGDLLILATGPLTSPELSEWLARATGRRHLYFYDAVSPTVDAASLDMDVVFAQSRYDKGGDDYLNCPFDKESYEAFVQELMAAERAPIHAFEAGGVRTAQEDGKTTEEAFLETIKYFSGCTPIEAIAEKGARSLAFGNFKPVGLTDPRTGRRPYAALQLRPENAEKTLYSLVACQTRLRWGEQKRVFRMVPGLQRAEFVRFGVIHRNTYLEAPKALDPHLRLRASPRVFVSGQLTGVEGYVESAAMGILTGLHAAYFSLGREPLDPPRETAYGSLLAHLRDDTPREFAPMNINWGLFPEPPFETRDKGVRREAKLKAARQGLERWLEALGAPEPKPV
jgi:methylenetetrahydrofolate--tRNA-(uracil-5-)-methyltransferase